MKGWRGLWENQSLEYLFSRRGMKWTVSTAQGQVFPAQFGSPDTGMEKASWLWSGVLLVKDKP